MTQCIEAEMSGWGLFINDALDASCQRMSIGMMLTDDFIMRHANISVQQSILSYEMKFHATTEVGRRK